MKTKDAFAFRDFDANNIFDFKGFYSAGSDDWHKSPIESVMPTLEEVIKRQRHVVNHLMRYIRYQSAVAQLLLKGGDADEVKDKLKRSELLTDRYKAINEQLLVVRKALESILEEQVILERQEFLKSFATRLRVARQAAGLTQRDMAVALRITPAAYSKYEQARVDPPLSSFVKILKILNEKADNMLRMAH